MVLPKLAVAGLAVLLTACGLETRYDAAESVRRFFAAVQSGDERSFNETVDRDAVRASLREGLMRARSGPERHVIERMLSGRRADEMLDRLISPESFRLVAQGAGARMARVPSTIEFAVALKAIDENRVCLRDGNAPERCVLTFERQGTDWKLVAVTTSGLQVRSLPAGRG